MNPRLWWELARRGFRTSSTYRAALVAGLFTNTVFAFLRGSILLAALDSAGRIAGYDRTRALTYVWLGQSLIAYLAVWNWNLLAERVRSGDIASDLSRPADLQWWWLAVDHGRAGFQVLGRGLPQFLIGASLYELAVPESAGRWLAFACSLWLALLISFGLRYLVNLCAFWILDFRGLLVMSNVLTNVCAGFLVPIAFFPSAVAATLRALPWYGMVQGPIDVFLGTDRVAVVLARQLVWAATLLAAGRAVQATATRRLVVQGG